MTQDIQKARTERMNNANALINAIASNGRKFFYDTHTGHTAYFTMRMGKLWYIDQHGRNMWLHHTFSTFADKCHDGGTLKRMLWELKDYIWTGKKVSSSNFGPWPQWICEGDLWGYGEDMKIVRAKALELGIIEVRE